MDRRQSPPTKTRREPDWTGMARVVRPTLIVAIGGTGTAAAKAARARMEHFLGSKHHYVAFRAFDTAFQDNREPRMVDNSEYVYLGGFNAQSVIADIISGNAFPHWAKWLPPRLNFQQVAFGAGGIRPIGRLCYFYRRDRVETAIQEALTAITDSDLALRFHQQTDIRVNLEAGIDIHLIGSVCGGTGSGIFLDLAFDLRRWAEEHTNREVTVTGHLVLPEAFRGKPVVMKALEANAYTALQELDRYMNASQEDPWAVEYDQYRTEVSRRAPFDHCYLLNGVQQGGTSGIETLTSSIGEAITLLTFSQVGQKVSEGVINMAGQRKSTRDEQGRVCCYSSYGVLGLEIPEELLGESLGPDLARALHAQLLQSVAEADATKPEDLKSFEERLQITNMRRIEEVLPPIELDLPSISLFLSDKRKQELGKAELQRILVEAHDDQKRERKRLSQEILFDEDELHRFLSDYIQSTLHRPGGLDRNLRYLARCVETLRSFQNQVRENAQELEDTAEKYRSAADALESGSTIGKDLKQLLDRDLEAWNEHVRSQTAGVVYRDQLPRIEKLIAIVQQEFIEPWTRIKGMLNNLRLEASRDEDAYYRARPARTSIGPLKWFRQALIAPNQERLVRDVLAKLTEESRSWATLEPKELNARFYDLCTEAIHSYFRSEAGMTCDRLLAECFDHPTGKYRTQVNELLKRAQANWEIHESYAMRDNRLEISAVGARQDSLLYGIVGESYRHISAVDEQRDDYVPILRTEHGMSLPGLKSLPTYRKSLIDSVVQEQRYDVHFFNDRRWVTRFEFAGDDSSETQNLYLFSAANMIGLIARSDGKGYFYGGHSEALGRYRREAYLAFCRGNGNLGEIQLKVLALEEQKDWRFHLERQIKALEETLEKAFAPDKSDQFLSLDIFQLHEEIRALLKKLQVEDMGL